MNLLLGFGGITLMRHVRRRYIHVIGVDMTHTEGIRQNHCRGVSRSVISAYTVRAVPNWYRRYVT